MKITEVKATPVNVDMEAPLRWNMGIETGTTRTIVELFTDEGIVGIGETSGGASTASAITDLCGPLLKGEDPTETGRIAERFSSYMLYRVPVHVFAGVEMACWDAAGKLLDKPVSSLLGGALKRDIPCGSYLFYRHEGKGGIPPIDSAKSMLDYQEKLESKFGKFTGTKIKGGVFPPEEELKTIKLFRETYGDTFKIRFDPNAAWTVEGAIRIVKQMEQYNLEFVEDPTPFIDGMSRVRREVNIPFSTNMCVGKPKDVMPAVRERAIDIISIDMIAWGGLYLSRKLVAGAELTQLGITVSTDRDLGISTAAHLHFLSAQPYVTHAFDSHYHQQLDDVITEPFVYKDGNMRVPDGPGLGVEIDRNKLERCANLYSQQGEVDHYYDPTGQMRTGWIQF